MMSGQSAASAIATVQPRMSTLSDLRVFELKMELEKRGLDKNGIKFALLERLETALREDGHDPKTYLFAVGDYGKCPSTAKALSVKRSATGEESIEMMDEEKEIDDNEKKRLNQVAEDAERCSEGERSETIKEDLQAVKLDEDGVKLVVSVASPSFSTQENEGNGDQPVVCGPGLVKDIAKQEGENDHFLKEASSKPQQTKDMSANAVPNKQRESNSLVETAVSTPAVVAEKVNSSHSQSISKKPLENSLWIRGIGPNTKAADLQALFSKYGRVTTAKIFTRKQQPSGACFGFVTMGDSETADLCIHKLNKTSIKGRIITVERADRSNMPFLKSVKKKVASSANTTQKGSSNIANAERPKSEERPKSSRELSSEKEKKDKSSTGKVRSSATEKASSHSGSDKQKVVKSASSAKKVPVKAPSASTSQYKSRPPLRERPQSSRLPPRFRVGRRIPERPDRFNSLRRPFGGSIHKPVFSSIAGRSGALPGRFPLSSRALRMNRFARREVSSRRVEPSWDKREVMEVLRKKEEEHRLKEQELRLQRERERLKFERERIERERLELQQWRQLGQFAAPQIPPMLPISRRSHESYDDVHSSSRRRGDYSRPSSERHPTGHHSSSSSSRISSERRDSRVSSRQVPSTHRSSSHGPAERERSRHGRDRDTRDYGSSSSREVFARDSHSGFGRNVDVPVSSYSKEGYRGTDVPYGSSHRSGDLGYSSRDMNYTSGSYGNSRSGGTASSWPVGSGTSAYISSSSRDYDAGGSWMSSVASSSQPHGVSGGQWQSSRAIDNWSSEDNYGQQGSHGTYEKYDSYEKYGRRY